MNHAIVAQEKANGVDLFGATENICVQVSEFNGKKGVDIRKWFKGKDEKFYRTQKGIWFPLDDWDDFVAQIDEINEFVRIAREQ
jgi:hypothetical protein